MANFPDHAQFSNLALLEEMYAKYRADATAVDPSWRHFFEGIAFAESSSLTRAAVSSGDESLRIYHLIQQYRKYGHLAVKINPIDPVAPPLADVLSLEKMGFSEADLDRHFPSYGLCASPNAPLREIVQALQAIYGSRIGFDYMHIEDPNMREFIQKKIEPKLDIRLAIEEKKSLLESLNRSEVFETFLHTKFVGQKRFSLEGGETLIPMLAEIVEQGATLGMEAFVIGMSHRGRLNVLANLLQKPYSAIFQEFEDTILPLLHEGSGDVKYHKGFSSHTKTRSGLPVHLYLAANSSSLESVDPVVVGEVRGRQVSHGDEARQKVGGILIHGDAAIAGQGVVYEVLELMHLPGYSTGGTIHIVVNNQIGFTTLPSEGRSTRYCTDIAKAFGCPVFHVNAEDPESCLFAAKLAVELRMRFGKDVFVDLNCYRKYGHNEGDEPAFTQPVEYRIIRSKRPIREIYLEQLLAEGSLEQKIAQELDAQFRTTLSAALERGKTEAPHAPEERFGVSWRAQPPCETLYEPFDSSAKETLLREVAASCAKVPPGFHLHPKLQKLAEERLAMMNGAIDWGMAECLAFGSLLLEKIPVRLSGQDSRRGTFSQRHAVWVDQETSALYCPLSHLSERQAQFDIYNSPLTEYAGLGFEYGYTWANPQPLVLWEAQFGDFAPGAQTIIDHYITTAEEKWARYSSLVLLLPHGYEGQGPEHSSARLERYLQLCANDNIQVVNPTTPAQYFHVLRRQALRPIKKPLVILTPKSLLRLPVCTSPLQDFTSGMFQEVLDDPLAPKKPSRLLLCSGKVYYDLIAERQARKKSEIAIARIEQLYPVHQKKLAALLARYSQCQDICWVQEEPENMGAWEFIQPHLQSLLGQGVSLRYVGRARNAVTATGSFRQHKKESEQFMNEAFK